MPVYPDDLIRVLAKICEEKHLTAAVKESLKGGLITGVGATLGGLLMGPVGLAIGGALGGGLATISAKSKFQSVAVIIMELPPQKKQMLCEEIKYAFRDFNETDLIALGALILANKGLEQKAVEVVNTFLSKQMNLQISEN